MNRMRLSKFENASSTRILSSLERPVVSAIFSFIPKLILSTFSEEQKLKVTQKS